MSCCNTENFNYFWICEPLARCAKRGSSLPLGTPMEIDFTSAYLHYPLPQCSKIVTPIIFSISYELFRLPSAKVPQDYQLLRTFVWCIMEKLTRNNGPFLDTRCQLIQSIKAMLMGAWIYFLKSSFQINMLTLEELNILEKSRSLHSLHACIIMVCFKNLSYRAFYVAKYKSSFLVSQLMHLILSNGKIQKDFISYMKSPLSHSTSCSLFHSILKWLWPSQEPSSCH